MRMRMAGLLAGLVAALGVLTVGAGSASAASSSTVPVDITFYQNGHYPAYADIWAYDVNNNLIGHVWSGTQWEGSQTILTVPAGTSTVSALIRMDPLGNTIHQQTIHDWWNFSCSKSNERPTYYVGGFPWSPDHYDLHCKKY
ncbi:hypothetical protein [Actinocrispum sp. NPDC049592]|uniref:hypothetical protein n=1 Tax=Actinocrispum sp. NPDC049592 TaxID=3154835 RepID=UPI00342075FE